ncbi:MAG: helix-turn-helix domain-containing protein [Pseudomonadota bacterium]
MNLHTKTPLPDAKTDPAAARSTWLDAAERFLVESGPDAVTVSALSRNLGLTRGAFYWHFKNREDLIADLVEKCGADAGLRAFEALPRISFDAGILSLLDAIHIPTPYDLRAMALDRALRRWGQQDAAVRSAVRRIDQTRRFVVEDMFRRQGYAADQARLRAGMLCDQIVLTSVEGLRYTIAGYATDLSGLFLLATGRELTASNLSNHLNHVLPTRFNRAAAG